MCSFTICWCRSFIRPGAPTGAPAVDVSDEEAEERILRALPYLKTHKEHQLLLGRQDHIEGPYGWDSDITPDKLAGDRRIIRAKAKDTAWPREIMKGPA